MARRQVGVVLKYVQESVNTSLQKVETKSLFLELRLDLMTWNIVEWIES